MDINEDYISGPQGVAQQPLQQEQLRCFYISDAPKPPRKRKGKSGKAAVAIILAVVLIAVSCAVTVFLLNDFWQDKYKELQKNTDKSIAQMQEELEKVRGEVTNAKPSVIIPEGSESQEGMLSPRQVYALNVDAVVAITSQGITTNIYGQTTEMAASGTGFIVSEDGYIVSNYHVVKGAKELEVLTASGTAYEAELVGYDEANDISLLKVDAAGLPCVTIGSSDKLLVGDQVAAIGNPLGELTSTLTVGYVSAMNRMVNTDGSYINMLQTDVAINSGNSGGPLFNMKGEVVGITTAKYSGTSNSGATIEGISFAIPIDDVKDMLEDLQELGYVESAFLGVMVQDVPREDVQEGKPTGALVVEVTEDTCAEAAGVEEQDIIVKIGEYEVDSLSSLSRALRKMSPGDTVTVTVWRSGDYVEIEATLDEKPRQNS